MTAAATTQVPAPAPAASTVLFSYKREFQIDILRRTVQDDRFLRLASKGISADSFESKELCWLFQTIVRHHAKHGTAPPPIALEHELSKASASGLLKPTHLAPAKEVLNQLGKPLTPSEATYVDEEILRFVRRQRAKRDVQEVGEHLMGGSDEDLAQLRAKLTELEGLGAEFRPTKGFDPVARAEAWLQDRLSGAHRRAAISTGINELDELLGGGLKPGQLGVWQGSTGDGKSIALGSMAMSAATHGKRALHVTLELGAAELQDRYLCAITGMPLASIEAEPTLFRQQLARKGHLYRERIRVEEMAPGTTVPQVQSLFEKLSREGFAAELLVVDYGDLLAAQGKHREDWQRLSAVFAELFTLAKVLDLPVWTATQTNRAGLAVGEADLDVMAGSIGKAHTADIVIAISGTKEDRAAGHRRLYISKNRNGPKGKSVEVVTDFACFRLTDVGKTASSIQIPRLFGPAASTAPSQPAPSMPAPVRRKS